MQQTTPTLDEFLSYSREALKFLEGFGFPEITLPHHRSSNPFELWFKADQRTVIVEGSGHGESASIYLEHDDSFELAVIYLVPKDKQPKKILRLTQLQQVSQSANWLKEYGTDFLEGDLERFFRYARPLPPYKLPR